MQSSFRHMPRSSQALSNDCNDFGRELYLLLLVSTEQIKKRSRCFGIEADAEAEGEAEAEASAGRVHGGNHCSPRRDEGSEASTS